jgi:hypothetical protein
MIIHGIFHVTFKNKKYTHEKETIKISSHWLWQVYNDGGAAKQEKIGENKSVEGVSSG